MGIGKSPRQTTILDRPGQASEGRSDMGRNSDAMLSPPRFLVEPPAEGFYRRYMPLRAST
jgi:hypothetical protein